MKIPKKFNLMCDEILVIIDENLFDIDSAYGKADFRQNKIFMIDQKKHKKFPESLIKRTFYHELLHHCFNQINETEICTDETIIDNLAGILSQVLDTADKDFKKFKIMNFDITVIDSDDIKDSKSSFEENKIFINKSLTKDHKQRCLYKEILWFSSKYLGEDKLYSDDKILFNIASLLMQAFSSMKY